MSDSLPATYPQLTYLKQVDDYYSYWKTLEKDDDETFLPSLSSEGGFDSKSSYLSDCFTYQEEFKAYFSIEPKDKMREFKALLNTINMDFDDPILFDDNYSLETAVCTSDHPLLDSFLTKNTAFDKTQKHLLSFIKYLYNEDDVFITPHSIVDYFFLKYHQPDKAKIYENQPYEIDKPQKCVHLDKAYEAFFYDFNSPIDLCSLALSLMEKDEIFNTLKPLVFFILEKLQKNHESLHNEFIIRLVNLHSMKITCREISDQKKSHLTVNTYLRFWLNESFKCYLSDKDIAVWFYNQRLFLGAFKLLKQNCLIEYETLTDEQQILIKDCILNRQNLFSIQCENERKVDDFHGVLDGKSPLSYALKLGNQKAIETYIVEQLLDNNMSEIVDSVNGYKDSLFKESHKIKKKKNWTSVFIKLLDDIVHDPQLLTKAGRYLRTALNKKLSIHIEETAVPALRQLQKHMSTDDYEKMIGLSFKDIGCCAHFLTPPSFNIPRVVDKFFYCDLRDSLSAYFHQLRSYKLFCSCLSYYVQQKGGRYYTN